MAWDAATREGASTPDGEVHPPAFVNGNGPGARTGVEQDEGAATNEIHASAQVKASGVSG